MALKKPQLLKDLEINEVSHVDRPANQHSLHVLTKFNQNHDASGEFSSGGSSGYDPASVHGPDSHIAANRRAQSFPKIADPADAYASESDIPGGGKHLVSMNDGTHQFRTGTPVTINYTHNTQKFPTGDAASGALQRTIEPKGEYMNIVPPSMSLDDAVADSEKKEKQMSSNTLFNPERSAIEVGTVSFKNPLVLQDANWKDNLSAMHGGKVGRSLTDAVIQSGHDGIITAGVNRLATNGYGEVVNLTGEKKVHRAAPSPKDVASSDRPVDKPTVDRSYTPLQQSQILHNRTAVSQVPALTKFNQSHDAQGRFNSGKSQSAMADIGSSSNDKSKAALAATKNALTKTTYHAHSAALDAHTAAAKENPELRKAHKHLAKAHQEVMNHIVRHNSLDIASPLFDKGDLTPSDVHIPAAIGAAGGPVKFPSPDVAKVPCKKCGKMHSGDCAKKSMGDRAANFVKNFFKSDTTDIEEIPTDEPEDFDAMTAQLIIGMRKSAEEAGTPEEYLDSVGEHLAIFNAHVIEKAADGLDTDVETDMPDAGASSGEPVTTEKGMKTSEKEARIAELRKQLSDAEAVQPIDAVPVSKSDELSPIAKAEIQKLADENKSLSEKITKMQADNDARAALEEARSLVGKSGVAPEPIATLLLKGDEESKAIVKDLLSKTNAFAKSARMFDELGSSVEDGGANVELNKAIEAVQKADPKLTPEQAMAKALEDHPELYDADEYATVGDE